MKKALKILLIILVVVILLGGVGLIVVKAKPELWQETFEKKTITETDTVTSFALHVASDEVEFLPSADGKLSVEYYEYSYDKFEYEYNNGCAEFRQKSTFSVKKLFHFISPNKPAMKIYLPNTVTEKLTIELSSGEIKAEKLNLTLKELKVQLSSGEISLGEFTADDVEITVSSGDLKLSNSTAKNTEISASSGEVEVTALTSLSTQIDLSSGDVEIRNSKLGMAEIELDSGSVKGFALTADGIECTVSSGDVNLKLTGTLDEYVLKGRASSGDIEFYNGNTLVADGENITYGSGAKIVSVTVSSGKAVIKIGAE